MKRKSKNYVPLKALANVKRFFPGVETVTDAKADITIEVTDRDNRAKGVRNHRECALAHACKNKLRADGVIVGTKTAYVIRGPEAVRYRLLESTSREIVSFDRKAQFAPGEYELKAPSKYEQLGVKQSGRTHGMTDRKQAPFRHRTSGIRTMLNKSPFTEEVAA